jgi:hypothetical protein
MTDTLFTLAEVVEEHDQERSENERDRFRKAKSLEEACAAPLALDQ